MKKIAYRISCFVILVSCFVILFASCRTPKQNHSQTNYQSLANFDSLFSQSRFIQSDWNKNIKIVFEEIEYFEPVDTSKNQPKKIKRAIIKTDESSNTLIVDTVTAHVSQTNIDFFETEIIEQPAPDPLKWRYIFGILLLLCISAYFIYRKFLK